MMSALQEHDILRLRLSDTEFQQLLNEDYETTKLLRRRVHLVTKHRSQTHRKKWSLCSSKKCQYSSAAGFFPATLTFYTPLHEASMAGNLESVKMLVKKEANLFPALYGLHARRLVINLTETKCLTPVHMAARFLEI